MKAIEILREAQKNKGGGLYEAFFWAAYMLDGEFQRAVGILEKYESDFDKAIKEVGTEEQATEGDTP
jgi:hypothetical protein